MDIDPSVLLMTLINFFILVLILKHFFWEKIRIAIQDREDFIQEQLSNAEDEFQKARLYLIENERILKSSKEEGKKIIEKKKQKANKVYSEIVDDANKEAKAIVDRARLEIEREKEKAQYEIKKQVVNLAIELSTKALEEKLEDSTQRELIGDFITKVGS
ncbi:F0F1 ATP synthase subunit B [Clostridium paraputrificum]|uniref:F0F1 ATP synthase subunit B n=1 Tax=Clostridium paraputrificum TaxID=29363 RepID=UPI000C06FA65|nr:F0F1 ATP synthase subunit B [Clostridium paraputrificum]